MKSYVIISAIILIGAAALAWRAGQPPESPRDTSATRTAKATSINPSRERADHKSAAKALSADYISLCRQQQNGTSSDPTAQATQSKRKAEFIEGINTLSAAQLRDFMADLRAAADLHEPTKQRMMKDFINAIAGTHPQSVLDFLMESPDLAAEFGNDSETYKRDALQKWAKDDPLATLDWLLANKINHPDRITDFDIFSSVTRTATTPEQRSEIYAALKEHFASSDRDINQKSELIGRAVHDLAFHPSGSATEFEETSAWIASAQLSEKELAIATKGMELYMKPMEKGQWMEWLSTSGMSEKLAKQRATEIAKLWTEMDYRAAGKWLSTAPNSPVKSAAVSSYASTVYPYDPENAMLWLQTLPQGPDRTKALETIHQRMSKDSDQAIAFAREHGLNQ